MLTHRQARWMEIIANFDMEIKYIPGKTNRVADGFSRYMEDELVFMVEVIGDLTQMIKDGYQQDSPLTNFLQICQDPEAEVPEPIRQMTKRFTYRDGLIYRDHDRVVVPNNDTLRLKIMQELHDTPAAGHFGFEKTYNLLSREFYWPKMIKNIKDFVASCEICQRFKSGNKLPAGLLQPLPIPSHNWDQIAMDFIVQLPKTKAGWDAIVVFVDRLSKQAHFAPTKTTATAPEIAEIFLNQVFRLHGMPSTIVSDRDAKFTSNFWKAFFSLHGTKLKFSTAYHPQTDGQTERTNRTLKQMLSIFCCYKQNDWDKYLAHAEFAYNNSQQTSTKKTPFFLNHGQHPRTPSTTVKSAVPAAQDLAETISDLT